MSIFAFLLLFVPTLSWGQDHARLGSDVIDAPERLLALTIAHEEKWHTYWKNPGDAGIATSFTFTLDGAPLKLEELEWPAPHRYLEAGDILTYGYEGDPSFFFKLPAKLHGELAVKVQWLICKDICIPGGASAALLVDPKGKVTVKTARSGLSEDELRGRLAALPAVMPWPAELEFFVSRDGASTLRLDYQAKGLTPQTLNPGLNLLTPFPAPPMGHKRESLRWDATENLIVGKFTVDWDGEYQEPPQPLRADGRFAPPIKLRYLYQTPQGKVAVIEKSVDSFSPTAAALEERFQSFSPLSGSTASTLDLPNAASPQPLALMLLLALLGGLILNLMPCVLPVISLKLFGLIKYQSLPRSQILRHNLAYSVGVIATFLILAGAVIAIKASGEAVGWGFQLQSPLFVLAMLGILFVLALNLFGLFEFRTPGGKTLGATDVGQGLAGDFFTGVLSTILSTPCSAPFLGTALAFAFTAGPATILLVFGFVGLGLAAPFVLTALFPQLVAFLPRPGAWMEKLKYFLGLTLLVTVVWLSDVFLNLVDTTQWIWPLALFYVSVFFAFFFRARISKNLGLNALFFLLPLALVLGAVKNFPLKPLDRLEAPLATGSWSPFAPELLEAHKGSWVFIDFTAQWCLTCKVNKKLVLDTGSFQDLMAKYDVVLLRGDWTQRDDTITRFLSAHNIVGVPAYFLQRPSGELVSLGETITLGKVREILEAAKPVK